MQTTIEQPTAEIAVKKPRVKKPLPGFIVHSEKFGFGRTYASDAKIRVGSTFKTVVHLINEDETPMLDKHLKPRKLLCDPAKIGYYSSEHQYEIQIKRCHK